jgi:glycosyltransferase involved in cell wall biosynthesis
MSAENLHLFTMSYPYGNGEPFLENELNYLSTRFKKIFIYPEKDFPTKRDLPENVELRNLNSAKLKYSTLGIVSANLGMILNVHLKEIFKANKNNTYLKHFREYNSRFCRSVALADRISEEVKDNDTDIYYSFWMNGSAEALSVLKKRKKIKKFVFRANGFDLYDIQAKYNYIPFRPFIFQQADKMFAVAKKGSEYMKGFDICPEKITYSYFGTEDHGVSVFKPEEKFTVFTCSDLRGIKRVDSMVDILKNIDFPVKWIHHGHKGDNENIFYEKIKQLPSNVEFILHERKENYSDVLKFFRENHFNLFVLLSSIEGLPVSLIEAISFGIPVLATDVGGVSEVINSSNGILIEKEFDPKNVAEKISAFSKSEMNTSEFRKKVREDWEQRFSAKVNYEKFYQKLIGHELN